MKEYKARITATLTWCNMLDESKQTKILDVKIITRKLDKKPTQSFFKSYLKLAVSKSWLYYPGSNLGMPIKEASGLSPVSDVMKEKMKISSISFISIEEYYD
jgi:hypothetical protein